MGGLCLDLDPEAGASAQAARDDRQEHLARQICDRSASASWRSSRIVADVSRRSVHPVASARTVLRHRRTALRHRQDDQAAGRKFTSNFPDAIELMVRGLRSGLPITETLGIVASEIPGPVGIEFRMVVGQDEDRPHDGGRASGNRRPSGHSRIPVLRDHAGDPARDRRQPRRDPVESRRRASQARADEAEDPRHELGIQGIGLHRRLAALRGVHARLDDQPDTWAASSPTSA